MSLIKILFYAVLGFLIGAWLGKLVIEHFMMPIMDKNTAYSSYDVHRPFVLDRQSCQQLVWFSTDPCWKYK